jgi:riboflavin biosynthesis pyrimidine reductase
MPSRNAGLPLEPLWPSAGTHPGPGEVRGGELPAPLAARFPGGLSIPLHAGRPTVIANFVSTIDGAVAGSPGRPNAGGGEISGFSETDRFMMALLRGLADVIVVGAGTIRNGRRHVWTAGHLFPALAPVFGEWRASMGLAPNPTTVVISGSGRIDPAHGALRDPSVPAVIVTTADGARRLTATAAASGTALAATAPNLSVVALEEDATGSRFAAASLMAALEAMGARVVLCEGGPTLFGELLGAGLVDELFLTLAPQLLGRDARERPLALVEGTLLAGSDPSVPGTGRWAGLAGVRRAGDDLYLRYRFEG